MILNKRFETFQEHCLDYVRCLLPSSISASLAINPRTKQLLFLRYKKNAGKKDDSVTKYKQHCIGRNRVSCNRDYVARQQFSSVHAIHPSLCQTYINVYLNQTSGVANLFASRCHAVSSMQSGCR